MTTETGAGPSGYDCPKCGQKAEQPCREPSGAKSKKPHAARVALAMGPHHVLGLAVFTADAPAPIESDVAAVFGRERMVKPKPVKKSKPKKSEKETVTYDTPAASVRAAKALKKDQVVTYLGSTSKRSAAGLKAGDKVTIIRTVMCRGRSYLVVRKGDAKPVTVAPRLLSSK